MNLLPDETVHLIVTSPPYWQIKDYGTENQIGYHESYERYINNLNLVWKECCRVLHQGCRLCINIGDQFARAAYYGRYKVIPIRTEIIRFCETIGLDHMGSVIWRKTTTMNTTGGAVIMGSFPYPRNGILKIDYEFILIFKKPGNPPKPDQEQKDLSMMTKEEWNAYFSGHWNFPGVRQSSHLAMFPEELPARLIKMFTFTGETVLDPFTGSGTTSLAARNLERNSVGYEINPEFIEIAKQKLNVHQPDIAGTAYAFLQDSLMSDPNEAITNLPYIFNDPNKISRKVNPKKHSFGSKIDKNSGEKQIYHSVKEIISPELIKLDTERVVRLIGIKEDASTSRQAIQFLKEKTRGQKVFMKFDIRRYDDHDNLLCYLYLKNKTFINAHLIKEGVAHVDTGVEFKYKNKFIKIMEQNKMFS